MSMEWREGMLMTDEELEELYRRETDPRKPGIYGSWWDVLICLLVCMSGYAVAWMVWEIL